MEVPGRGHRNQPARKSASHPASQPDLPQGLLRMGGGTDQASPLLAQLSDSFDMTLMLSQPDDTPYILLKEGER